MSTFTLLLVYLLHSVLALPLVPRDVVDPPITNPTANTVWHVGQTQTVTWSTANLPVNQTNPIGKLVLGYMYNNSENLMLNSPLATNINYSVGQVQISVPNVPTRSDYIVVLFGDSGNASPEFTIINDASETVTTSLPPIPLPTSSSGSSSPTASTPASTTPPANPNSSGDSGGSSTPMTGSPTTGVSPTTTAPSQTTSSHTSTTITVTSSSTPSSTQSNAAWQKHVPSVGTYLSVTFTIFYFIFS